MNISKKVIEQYNFKIIIIPQEPDDFFSGDFYFDTTNNNLNIGHKTQAAFTERDFMEFVEHLNRVNVSTDNDIFIHPHIWR